MIYYNGHFHTMKGESDIAKGLLINNEGVIEKVLYKDEEIEILTKSGLSAHNLQAGHIYPGFVDTHTHSFEGGLYANAADLEAASSINDLLDILTASDPINNIVVGYHLDENNLKEKRFPTLKELDRAFPNKGCIIRRVDGHSLVINSIVYHKSGVEKKLPRDYNFDGLLRAEYNDMVSGWFHKNIDEEGITKAYQKAAQLALQKGHTTVHTMVGDGKDELLHYELVHKLQQEGAFPIEFVFYPQVFNLEQVISCKEQLGSEKVGRIGGCILADGSFGSRTAALSLPYSESNNKGILYKSDSEWYQFIKAAHNENLQVAIHCIGDAAIKQIVEIYCQVQQENQKVLRHQVIHCELITDEAIISKMAKYNIAAVMQPMFDKLWGGDDNLYAKVLGKTRASQCNRFKSLLAEGVLVTGSSDWYVIEMDALAGIEAAVNLHNEEERIAPYQALELYTSNPAKLIGREEEVGCLKEGAVADFVCLSKDILSEKNIATIPIKRVYKKGRSVL